MLGVEGITHIPSPVLFFSKIKALSIIVSSGLFKWIKWNYREESECHLPKRISYAGEAMFKFCTYSPSSFQNCASVQSIRIFFTINSYALLSTVL